MKQLKLLILLSLFGTQIHAQNFYSFSETTDTYTELTGATKITPAFFSTGAFHDLPLMGKQFKIYDLVFTFGGIQTFAMQPNGVARIDNDSSLIIIDALFTFLDSIDNTSELSYKIEGNNGNHIVKMQWKNLKLRGGDPNNFVNCQIWVHQKTGVIENRYGPSSADNQVGFTSNIGPQVGIFYSPDNFSTMYSKLWVNGHPNSLTLDSNKTFSFNRMQAVPPQGTVYRFTPRFGALSSKEIKKESFAVFPNPTNTGISFSVPLTGQIINSLGKTILSFSNQKTINIEQFATGVYTIILENGAAQKIIKK